MSGTSDIPAGTGERPTAASLFAAVHGSASAFKSPKDFLEANRLVGAMCGHGAFAAATGLSVVKACEHFDGLGRGKRWVNIPDMERALRSLRAEWRPVGAGWPAAGLVIVQFVGPWCEPGVPPAAACRHTHWVASRERYVWDVNAEEWLARDVWEKCVHTLFPRRAAGWRVKRGYEVTPNRGAVRPATETMTMKTNSKTTPPRRKSNPKGSHERLGRRTERRKYVEEERWWEVEVNSDARGWVRSSEHGERAKADELVKLIVTLHGAKWKKLMRVVEVVAVTRTERVVKRKPCVPTETSSPTREKTHGR